MRKSSRKPLSTRGQASAHRPVVAPRGETRPDRLLTASNPNNKVLPRRGFTQNIRLLREALDDQFHEMIEFRGEQVTVLQSLIRRMWEAVIGPKKNAGAFRILLEYGFSQRLGDSERAQQFRELLIDELTVEIKSSTGEQIQVLRGMIRAMAADTLNNINLLAFTSMIDFAYNSRLEDGKVIEIEGCPYERASNFVKELRANNADSDTGSDPGTTG